MAIDNGETTVSEIKPKNKGIMSGGGRDDEETVWPPWVEPMLQESFFVQCKLHFDSQKSECNMYCLDCMNGSLCSLCLPHHTDHRSIQIRRSSYHNVIRVNEIEKHLDITEVHTYIINGAKVVFLNERPQSRLGKGVTNNCHACRRALPRSSGFCSLGCKIVGTSKNFEEKEEPPETVSSCSEESCISNNAQSLSQPTPRLPSVVNYRTCKRRRKGIPHRAPMRRES